MGEAKYWNNGTVQWFTSKDMKKKYPDNIGTIEPYVQQSLDGIKIPKKAFKRDYDSFLESAKFAFAERVKELFDRSISGSLASIMSDWYEHLPDNTRNHVFSSDINELLHFIRNNDTHDDIIAFERLAKRMTMLAVEDWSENTASEFFCDIDKYIKTVNEYTEARNADQGVKMSLDFGGTVYERNIETTEISGIAETALNNVESALTEYGDAITAQERIALLLKLLKHEIAQL